MVLQTKIEDDKAKKVGYYRDQSLESAKIMTFFFMVPLFLFGRRIEEKQWEALETNPTCFISHWGSNTSSLKHPV